MAGSNLLYSKDHEWVRMEGNIAVVGITDFAQAQLGDIVYVELPEISTEVEKDEAVCAVESVKTAAEVITPVSGTIVSVNEELDDEPERINEDAYEAWIIQIEVSDLSELDGLLDESEYAEYCENEG